MADNNARRKPLRPSELGSLYPVPKSYDDLLKDTEERQERFETNRTKLPAFKIAFLGTMLFIACAYYATTVELLWLVADRIVLVFSFAIWVILFLFAIRWLRYTLNIFYEYSSRSLLFWIIYGVGMSIGAFLWQKNVGFDHTNYIWLVIFSGLNFLLTYILAKLLIKRS